MIEGIVGIVLNFIFIVAMLFGAAVYFGIVFSIGYGLAYVVSKCKSPSDNMLILCVVGIAILIAATLPVVIPKNFYLLLRFPTM